MIEDVLPTVEESEAFLALQTHPSWPVYIKMIERNVKEKLRLLIDPNTLINVDILRGILFSYNQITEMGDKATDCVEAARPPVSVEESEE